jgi:hypothetical protein
MSITPPVRAAINVSLSVNASNTRAVMPDSGIGLHTSVYANQFANPSLPSRISESGVDLLRYPGGSYSDLYHWSNNTSPAGGYVASTANLGQFVKDLDQSGAKSMMTVNYGSSLRNTMGGQPQEAAAWVAYTNSDPSIYGTPDDINLGIDAEGNNWRTAGYWAKLRTSTTAQYQTWATADGVYNAQNNILAINHSAAVGVKYWEIGNEIGGNGYTGTQWEYDLHAPYAGGDSSSNVGRAGNPLLSPTAYANNTLQFVAAMKAVDPTIKIGVGLDLAASTANQQILSVVGNQIDFGIVHWYPGGSSNATTNATQVLNAPHTLPSGLTTLRNQIQSVVGPNNYEIHMTEFGYFGAQLAAGLDGVFAANTYATDLENGVQSAEWLEMSKNSFIGDSSALTRGSAFYGIQVFSHIAPAGSTFLTTNDNSSGNNSVDTHATLLPDGRIGIFIANLGTSSASDANVTIDLSGPAFSNSGTEWLYGVNQLTPLQSTLTGLGNHFTITVPYRSIVSLVIASVPEPSALTLVLLGGLMPLSRRFCMTRSARRDKI